MKVSELIEALSKLDPEMDVKTEYDGSYFNCIRAEVCKDEDNDISFVLVD